ncbi:MAG: DegV family protein [Oscillospiraceae bacterium]|jgi:DegV family protein with EDD domain|nr:DegV family protein [Oscillospiraceae bacterium]
MNAFSILIDTNADLPEGYIEEHDLSVIPVPFNLDGTQHSEGNFQKITAKEFYDALRNGGVAGTALINPESYVDVFKSYAEKKEPLLLLTLSSGLSGTYQNSVIALDDVRGDYPDCEIRIVDCSTAAGGSGLVTVLAVKKRGEGVPLDEAADWLEEKKQSCLSLFTVNDLMYLYRGGRLSKLSAIAGSIIGVKPLLNVAPDGTLKLKDKVRGRKGAIKELVGQMMRSLNPGQSLDTVLISHTDCLEDAEALAEIVRSSVEVRELHILMMGPVIGAHVGPGTLALFFEADMTRSEYDAKFYKD